MAFAKTKLFEENLQEQANFFKTLAHPARLQILQFLSEMKNCVSGDISDDLPLSRSTVNQHLKELKEAGLIRGHVDGVKMNYCLDYDKIFKMKELLGNFMNKFPIPEDFCCQQSSL